MLIIKRRLLQSIILSFLGEITQYSRGLSINDTRVVGDREKGSMGVYHALNDGGGGSNWTLGQGLRLSRKFRSGTTRIDPKLETTYDFRSVINNVLNLNLANLNNVSFRIVPTPSAENQCASRIMTFVCIRTWIFRGKEKGSSVGVLVKKGGDEVLHTTIPTK